MEKTNDLEEIAFADLYAMYLFVTGEANRHFNTAPEARKVVIDKQKELRKELCNRTYGFDPVFENLKVPKTPDKSKLAKPVVVDIKED
jgi:hypothetical protein